VIVAEGLVITALVATDLRQEAGVKRARLAGNRW
jgi:hypothetical protein